MTETATKKTISKIKKNKKLVFEKINHMDKSLARCIKIKRERTEINKIRKVKEVTTDNTEIQNVVRDYCNQLYANRMDNLEEMDQFLGRYDLPRLKQEKIENMNRPSTSNELETLITNRPTNKSPGPDGFTGYFYPTRRKELTPTFLKLFQTIGVEGTL